MTLHDVIERLYDSEINAGLQAEWDAGITVWLGDDYNGRQVQATFSRDEFDRMSGGSTPRRAGYSRTRFMLEAQGFRNRPAEVRTTTSEKAMKLESAQEAVASP
jgi:hypothetical protein